MRKLFLVTIVLTNALFSVASEIILFLACAKVALIAIGVIYLVVNKV